MAQLAVLNRRVAEAADAWLTDPSDVGVYGRLVAAVTARRALVHPTLDGAAIEPQSGAQRPPDAVVAAAAAAAAAAGPDDDAVDVVGVLDGPDQDDELLDELADHSPVQAVGVALAGDPRAVLDQLRHDAGQRP